REDLFYRLNVIPIVVPPLRERRDDIPLLAENILSALRRRGLDRVRAVSPEAMRCLMAYPWPGNIRELENVLERGAVCSRGSVLSAADLPEEVREPCRVPIEAPERAGEGAAPSGGPGEARGGEPPSGERERLLRALQAHRWNRGAAAAALGMDRSTLWRKMKRLGIA
ncbi:MAG: helix-turn-helix domain-containing protein, partial [Verrucomicrobiota bacterium]